MSINNTMSINTKIKQIAYGHATAQVLSELGSQENWYKAYEYLFESVVRGDEPEDLVVWQPFENWKWEDILEQIESEANSLLSTIKLIFSLTDLDLDLDLGEMVELGSRLKDDGEECL